VVTVIGRLVLECLGERNHGFADLGVGKRGEPYQKSLKSTSPGSGARLRARPGSRVHRERRANHY
jgi:hypothetical protein